MEPPTLYELVQAHKGDAQYARLLHALDEVAARIEVGCFSVVSVAQQRCQLSCCPHVNVDVQS